MYKTKEKESTSQKNIQPHDPFLPGNESIVQCVEDLENPVHQNVVSHLEDGVEELSKRVPVHFVDLLSVLPVQLKQDLNHRQIKLKDKYVLIMFFPLTWISDRVK